MAIFDSTLLYVTDVTESVKFYSQLLNKEPVEMSSNFAMFILDSGFAFGLWAKHDVEPQATNSVGGSELIFHESTDQAIDATYSHWSNLNITMLQAPNHTEFGYTFVAIDPNGHRIRVLNNKD